MYIAKLPLKQWYILLWISKTQNCWETTFKLCIEWRKKSFENLQLLINHIQIVYWMKEKSFESLQLLINHSQIAYRMKETSIWELRIVDKSHSLTTLFEICVEIAYLMMKIILRILLYKNLARTMKIFWQSAAEPICLTLCMYNFSIYVHLSFEEQILLHTGCQPKPQNLSNWSMIKLFTTICHIWTLPIVTHPSLTIVCLNSKDMYKICDQIDLFI